MEFHSYEASKLVKLKKTEYRMVAAKGQGKREIGNYDLMDTEFQFCKMKRVLELNGGDGCTTL
jgi:hypothetical protein